MGRCFVAQPFDDGEFDKRYAQVYEPAIMAAGLEAYRVDRDPGAAIPIDTMINEIKSCSAFFVDITRDNPNVWFELGLAIAYGQHACIVCAATRIKFPFDIQHRKIIRYKMEAPADFVDLKREITARLQAIVKQQASIEAVEERLSHKPQLGTGLSDLEVLTLTVIANETRYFDSAAAIYSVYNEMSKIGYFPVATSIAMRRLTKAHYITQYNDTNHNGEEYVAVKLADAGWQWIEENLDRIPHRKDDDIPF